MPRIPRNTRITTVSLSIELADKIEEYHHRLRLPSRSAAVMQLIQAGIDAQETVRDAFQVARFEHSIYEMMSDSDVPAEYVEVLQEMHTWFNKLLDTMPKALKDEAMIL